MEVAENPTKSRRSFIKRNKIMKKVLVLLAAGAVLACFTSCNKPCTCKTYAAGIVVTTDDDVEVESGKKCKDMSHFVTDDNGENKTGVECK